MRTLYVATVYWRDNDALFSVAGYDQSAVKARTESLMDQTLSDEYDDIGETPNEETHNIDIAYARACNGTCADCGATPDDCFKHPCPSNPEYQAFADRLCWTGVNAWDESEAREHGALGIPKENREELEQDGITVY